jgi:hypothetical protein
MPYSTKLKVLYFIIANVLFTVIFVLGYYKLRNSFETRMLAISDSKNPKTTKNESSLPLPPPSTGQKDSFLSIQATSNSKNFPKNITKTHIKTKTNLTPKIMVFTIAIGDPWYKSLIKANRENYCTKHGYQLLILENLTRSLEGHNINWSKITEGIQVLLASEPYDWIWFADIDLLIMNQQIKIEKLVKSAVAKNYLEKLEKATDVSNITLNSIADTTDIIIAKDGNGFNFGSILVRNSDFSRWVFQEMWNKRAESSIPMYNAWHEQAVFTHLTKTVPGLNSHMSVVPQKYFNAYSNQEGRMHYKYMRGDFVIHFPGGMKNDLKNYVNLLVELQPELKQVERARLEACAKQRKSCN